MHRSFAFVASVVAAALSLLAGACLDVSGPSCVVEAGAYHGLTLGDTVNDSLTSRRCEQFYQISVSGQQNLRVVLTSPGLETFLHVVDSSGTVLVNSAVTSGVDTATTLRMMLGPGRYAVAVIPFSMGQSGTYRFVATQDASPAAGCGVIWVTAGVTTTQSITRSDCAVGPSGANYFYHAYEVMLKAGLVTNITEYSTALGPQLTLVGPDGTQSSTVDSLGTTALLNTPISTSGAYRVWVGSASAGQVGTYTLSIQ